MSQDRRNRREPDVITGAQRAPAGNAGDAAARIAGLQRRIKRLRGKTIAAVLLALAIFAGAVWGGSAASVREQSIRLMLGQKNYKEEGTEGPQYYAAEYKDAGELREAGAEMGRDIAREGIVLLKNENGVLPLRKGAAVSVFGKAAVKPVLSSSAAVKLETVSRGDAVAQDGIDQSVVSRRGQNSGRKERAQQHDRDHNGNQFSYNTCSHSCLPH